MAEKIDKDYQNENEYWEGRQNLLGFFSLLLEIDMRVNPQLYKKQNTIKTTGKELKPEEKIKE